jgi:hypothetical protein
MRTVGRIAATMLWGGLTFAAEIEPTLRAWQNAYDLETQVTAGYRVTDVDGSEDKYREDVDLDAGARLFDLRFRGRARDPDATFVDRFLLEVDTPHDEPVSRFRLSLTDSKRYDLRAAFTKSKYFYDVPQLFEASVPDVRRVDDLHGFDLTRERGSFDLTVHVTDDADVLAGYRFYRRHGDTRTTQFIPGADTFLLRQDVDATTNLGFLGTQLHWLGSDILLRQEFRHTDRTYDSSGPIPGGSLGLDPDNGASLQSLSGDQHERIDSPTSIVRVRRAIGERAELTGAYLYSHAELDVDGDLARSATVIQPVFPDRYARTSDGSGALDAQVVDLGASVVLAPRVRWSLDYRFDERSQSADLTRLDTYGRIVADTGYDVRQQRVTTAVDFQVRDDLSIRIGGRYGLQYANLSSNPQDFTTDALGVLADIRWRPWRVLDLFARYESLHLDDPVTTPGAFIGGVEVPDREIAPTFVNRGSTGFRLSAVEWAGLSYRLTADSRENTTFSSHLTSIGNHVTVDLTPRPDLTAFVSYSRRDIDDDGDIRVAPLYAPMTALQSGSEDVVVAQITHTFGLLGERWSAGSNVSFAATEQVLRPAFETNKSRTAFDIRRVDTGAYLLLHHAWIEPAIEFRYIQYDERVLPENDYRATIVTFKLTHRWSN